MHDSDARAVLGEAEQGVHPSATRVREQAAQGRSGVVGPRWASFGPTVGMLSPFSVFSIFQ